MKTMRRLLTLLVVVLMTPAAYAVDPPNFQIMYYVIAPTFKIPIAEVDYRRQLPSGASWIDGDRRAYKEAYTFLVWQGEVVARVTFEESGSYPGGEVVINDRYMGENRLDCDGTPFTPAELAVPEHQRPSCVQVIPAPPLSPGNTPVITFKTPNTAGSLGVVIETRNYANALHNPARVQFRIISASATRVVVASYLDGTKMVETFYDLLSPNVVMSHN